MLPSTTMRSKSESMTKNSCGDLQSRLKIRKVLGVGDRARSKISQILGQSDEFIFHLPRKLELWLFLTTTLFICFTIVIIVFSFSLNIRKSTQGLISPSYLRLLLPGHVESSLHLGTSYAFLSAILGLTLRSGDRNSLRLVLLSLTLFHSLSCLIAIWFLSKDDKKTKSTLSLLLHLFCGLINVHFYRSVMQTVSSSSSPSSFRSDSKLKRHFQSLLSFPSTYDILEHDQSSDK